jgi:hypothetical protein
MGTGRDSYGQSVSMMARAGEDDPRQQMPSPPEGFRTVEMDGLLLGLAAELSRHMVGPAPAQRRHWASAVPRATTSWKVARAVVLSVQSLSSRIFEMPGRSSSGMPSRLPSWQL